VQKIYSPEKIVRIRIGYEWCIDVSMPPSVVLSLYPSLYDCMLVQYVKPNSLECYALNRYQTNLKSLTVGADDVSC
jgi:hypothetical protein